MKNGEMLNMLDAIIFSKNRACQLDLLLRSIDINAHNLFDEIRVLYTATTQEFELGYEKLIGKHNNVLYYNQTDFQRDTFSILKSCNEYVCFFVDDNIIYKNVDITQEILNWHFNNLPLACFSLRLGTNIEYDDLYTGIHSVPPAECQNFRFKQSNIETACWKWIDSPKPHGGFGYPFSVDGHIYMKDELLAFIDYEFDTPNALEGRFDRKKFVKNNYLMASQITSSVVNNPLNLVGSSNNKAGIYYQHTLEELNDKFLNDHEINLSKLCDNNIIGCHQEMEIWFEKV